MNLCIKLINLEHNQENLGEIKFEKLNFNNKPEWYNLIGLFYFSKSKMFFFLIFKF